VKKKILTGRAACLFLMVILVLCTVCPAVSLNSRAAVGAITDVVLSSGSDAPAALERQGLSPLMCPLCGSGESAVYLGYERGGKAPVTGLVLSRQSADTLTVRGAVYQIVSRISVSDQEEIYLYLTRDASAGTPLTAITLTAGSGYEDAPLYALLNDGTAPLRYDDGAAAELDGESGSYLYLLRQNVCKPYISSVHLTFGADKRAAVQNAAAQGCNYYYDGGLTDDEGRYLVVGYNRTADEADALRSMIARPLSSGDGETMTASGVSYHLVSDTVIGADTPCRLYASKDAAAGNPILDLTSSAIPARSTDVLGRLTQTLFVKSASNLAAAQAKGEPLYQQLVNSREPLAHVPVMITDITDGGERVRTPLAYTCLADGLSAEALVPADETQSLEKEVLVLEGLKPGETVVDDFDPDTYLDQKPEVIVSDKDPVAVASIFGKGKVTDLLIILAMMILGIAAGAVMFRMKKRKEQKSDDQE
jgi:hypothetical protein